MMMDVRRNVSKDGKCSCIRSMLDYGKCLVALTTGQICTQSTNIPEVTTHGDNSDMSSSKTPITDFFKLPKVCVAPFINGIPTNTDFKHTDEKMNKEKDIYTPYFPLFPCNDLEKTFSQPKYQALRRRRNAIACVTDFSSKIKHCENKRALLNNNTTRKCKKSVANGLLFSSEAVVGVSSVDLRNPCDAETNNTNNNNEDVAIRRRQKRTKRISDDVLTRRIMELKEECKVTYTDVQPVSLDGHRIDVNTRKIISRSKSGSTSGGSSSGSVGRLKELKNVETIRRKRAATLPTDLSTSSTSGICKDVLLRRRNAIAPYSATY